MILMGPFRDFIFYDFMILLKFYDFITLSLCCRRSPRVPSPQTLSQLPCSLRKQHCKLALKKLVPGHVPSPCRFWEWLLQSQRCPERPGAPRAART